MAYIRRRKGSWQTVIRVQGYPPITKTFKTKIDAQRYSRDLENKLLGIVVLSLFSYPLV
jgi:hypothetical protein